MDSQKNRVSLLRVASRASGSPPPAPPPEVGQAPGPWTGQHEAERRREQQQQQQQPPAPSLPTAPTAPTAAAAAAATAAAAGTPRRRTTDSTQNTPPTHQQNPHSPHKPNPTGRTDTLQPPHLHPPRRNPHHQAHLYSGHHHCLRGLRGDTNKSTPHNPGHNPTVPPPP